MVVDSSSRWTHTACLWPCRRVIRPSNSKVRRSPQALAPAAGEQAPKEQAEQDDQATEFVTLPLRRASFSEAPQKNVDQTCVLLLDMRVVYNCVPPQAVGTLRRLAGVTSS
jgi:hypothetical protein